MIQKQNIIMETMKVMIILIKEMVVNTIAEIIMMKMIFRKIIIVKPIMKIIQVKIHLKKNNKPRIGKMKKMLMNMTLVN